MKATPTKLPGVIVIEPDIFRDARGFFLEVYNAKRYAEAGVTASFVQDNQSRSIKGTLRGLHFQYAYPQAKLIRVLSGEIFDVAVDIRRSSPTFKQWTSAVLSSENFHQLYVPTGFAHGFQVLSDTAEVEYKCSDFYNKPDEGAILWSDPELGVEWPIRPPVVSPKDHDAPLLRDIMEKLPVYGA
jgi:dTDP-4-dehydrorhamnose 3,5-epimerase